MMKRKVRIYKDPNGQGGYVNKTAQWLNKADEGLQTGVTPVTAGIMGQMQNAPTQSMQYQQPQQSQEDMMLQEVTGMISKGIDKEEIKLALLAKLQVEQGTPEYSNASAQLDSYLESVYDQLGEEARIDTNEKLNLPTGEFDETVDAVEETPAPNYYNDLVQEDNSNDDANAELDAEGDDISFSRYGGTPSKSAFIKRTLKQLKKAADGQETGEETGYTATARGTENNPSKSPGYMDSFIAGIKSQVEEDILRKDAEAMYNNMYGQGMPPQDVDYGQDDMDYAQFGGGAGRRMRRGMRKVFGRGATPPGVTSSKFTYGPLGGVRTADVQFNPLMMMSMFPGMTSGMGGFGYSGGYNSQQNRHSAGRLVTERVAKTINKDAIVEVAGATDGDAPKKAAETVVVNSDGTTTTTKADGTVTTVPTVVTNTKPQSGNKKLNPGDNGYVGQPKVDKWGRPEDSEWYGFNPTTKQYEIEGKGHRWDNVTEPKVNPTLYENYYLKNHFINKIYDDKGNIKGEPKTLGLDGKYLTEAQRKKIKEDRAKRQKEYDNSNIFSQMWNGNPQFEERDKLLEGSSSGLNPDLMPTGVGALQIPASFGKTFLNSPQKLLRAYGGSINDLTEDPYGNLQQFVYGGDEPIDDSMLENLYQPPINEQDIDYTDSEDVTDPYFKRNGGGLYRFQGTGSSQVSGATTPTPFTAISSQEDYNKKLEEEKKKWQTDYDKTLADKQRQQQYDPRGYMSQQQYGSYGVNQPVWGQPQYGGGRGLFRNLYSPYTRGPKQYSPVGDPLQYAATASMISKSGMLPTGVKYAKERKQDGNFFEKNLGFNKDRVWTLDYSSPEQIKAKAEAAKLSGKLNTSNPIVNPTVNTNVNTNTSTNTNDLKGKSRRAIRKGEKKMRGTYSDEIILDEDNPLLNTPVIDDKPIPIAPKREYTDAEMGIDPRTYDDLMKEKRFGVPIEQMSAEEKRLTDLQSQKNYDPNNPTGSSNTAWQSSSTPSNQIKERVAIADRWREEQKINPTGQGPGSLEKRLYSDWQDKNKIINLNNRLNFPVLQTNNQMPEGFPEMAYGGYIPSDYYAYGGYLPEAQGGLDVSPVSFAGNPVIGLSSSPTWDAMSSFNNQNKDIEGPIDKNKYYNEGPLDNDCTDEDKLDPKSDCYDPQSAQLKIKEEKSGTINYDNIARGYNTAANLGADSKNYIDERMKVWVPGMTNFAYGEKEKANEVVNRGPFDARTGRDAISGFEGVIKKGGSIGHKKGGEYSLTMQEIHDLIRDGGLVEFLD
jgi:hypothetical protein